jgi:hypothetical protein
VIARKLAPAAGRRGPVANVGHGHVYPRTDGVKMRCGGVGICSECSRDKVRKDALEKSKAKDSKEKA